MRITLLYLMVTLFAAAQSPDPFSGTWKLNINQSRFMERSDTYTGGTRTYARTQDGTRVTWRMSDAEGTPISGEYTAHCKNRICVSDQTRWTETALRRVEGKILANGIVNRIFTRVISPDGKTLTISFFHPGTRKPTSIQVWNRLEPEPR